ncbi:MAG: hypothetical protein AAF265_10050 [Pseudomonadota bacterium]
MRQRLVLWAGLLIVILAATLFFKSYDRIPYEVSIPAEGEVSFNPYFPIELTLQELGLNADSMEILDLTTGQIGPNDAVLIPLNSQFVPESRRRDVMEWVNNGGHLILELQNPDYMQYLWDLMGNQSLPALAEWVASFGFEVESRYEEAQELDEAHANDDSTELYLDHLSYSRLVQFDDTVNARIREDALGVYAAQVPSGEGHVSLIIGASISNYAWYFGANGDMDAILDHDFVPVATLVADMVAGDVPSDAIWLVYSAEFASLWELLKRNAPQVVTASAILLLLWLWSSASRFGPIANATPTPRRSIMEHIEATGRFAWRLQGLSSLTDEAIRATQRAAERRDPGLSQRPAQQQAERIARLTGEPLHEIAAAMNPGEHDKPSEFVEAISTLQKIRNEL